MLTHDERRLLVIQLQTLSFRVRIQNCGTGAHRRILRSKNLSLTHLGAASHVEILLIQNVPVKLLCVSLILLLLLDGINSPLILNVLLLLLKHLLFIKVIVKLDIIELSVFWTIHIHEVANLSDWIMARVERRLHFVTL